MIHLGALQVNLECRYGLKKDFWLVRAGNSSQPLGRGQVPSNLPPHPPPPIPNTFPHVDHVEGVLAQLLAWNNPSDPLINLLNPAPQPPTPQQNPEPVQHAPAISESQGQSHIAPVQQPLHDDVTRRLDSLEKLVAEHLPLRSINSYTEITSAFAIKFSSQRLIRKTTSELMRVRQRDGESLKNFMSKFNDAVLEVSSFDQAVGITYVISRLSHERFRDSLLKHSATTFSEPQGVRNLPNRQGVVYQQTPPPLPPPARIIHMITGGLEAGGLSSKQQKLYVREVKHQNRAQKRKFDDAEWKNQPITFTSADLDTVVTPHNDPLVTSVTINNCERYDGPIYGFNNQPVPVEGVLTMNVAFGSGRSYVTPSVRFLVVKMAFSFNVVIGRPTLIEIQAVVSQSHLCMKFPTPMGIATLRGNQEVARHCYITSITQPQKGKDQTPKANPKRIPDNRQVMGVEIVENRLEDETRAAPVEDVEENRANSLSPSKQRCFCMDLNRYAGNSPSVSQHKLSTNLLKKPIAQKQRLFGGERLTVIKEEVEKLLQAGFIKQVDYCEWVANPVLVKKANGKWQMCIDYTNLNQACPKDCYPMPNIDKLVEAAFGNERLSLLDAYSCYHQVPMAPTRFQWLLKMKKKPRSMPAMKSIAILKVGDHLTDLKETFNNLRKNKMRLNPAKCIFGVESRKFLSFMVSRRGIKVNPKKIKAVAEMEPPKSVKDIQRLTGRVAALHRFISKSADKCLPFFKIMRSAAQNDESGHRWRDSLFVSENF
ncbi:hypothetical protein SLEP1_g53009 [Rubroshorea leprosula]|uniref:Retrotransposon gag domain-containing protein n=1 Tax=Rubroshorea leprosula TaxID=152421 RepID=A0AAV5M822_9ROSI|nr:hypothetical protein SLEP1_g53009 [Rubroshorea leprosula]